MVFLRCELTVRGYFYFAWRGSRKPSLGGRTFSGLKVTDAVQPRNPESRKVAFIHLATASIAFTAGAIAVLETFPHQPLFDLQFIYSTVTVFAEMAIAFGLIGLLMVPATFRTSGWRQWFFVVSVLLASAGFSGGAWVISLVGRGS